MKNVFYTAVVYLLLCFPCVAKAEDGCTLALEGITSFIDSASPEITTMVPERFDASTRSVTHKVRLKNRTEVELSLGGCTHYGYTLVFSHVEGLQTTLAKEAIRAIIERNILLLPVKENSGLDDVKNHVLDAQNWNPTGLTETECGDYQNCSMDVEDGTFTLSYSFAL